MSKKILLIDTMHFSFTDILNANGFECFAGEELTEEEVIVKVKDCIGIAIRSRLKLNREFLQKISHINFIARAGAGMENIDTITAEELNITCLNAPEGNRDAVGEHAIGMLLSLMNNLLKADAEVRKGLWKREENRGFELQGKTIGIIGFGNMGSSFAKKLQGFEVNILAYDKYITIDKNKFPYVNQVELDEIKLKSDVISLHVPLTHETQFMVDSTFLNSFSKPIWLINTARGKILNTKSLVEAIETNQVTGAALDVLEYENTSFEHLNSSKLPEPFQYLIRSNKVILSPHIGGWTFESNEKIARILSEKIINLYVH